MSPHDIPLNSRRSKHLALKLNQLLAPQEPEEEPPRQPPPSPILPPVVPPAPEPEMRLIYPSRQQETFALQDYLRLRMMNTGHRGPGRFFSRSLNSMSGQGKLLIAFGLVMWALIFFTELLPFTGISSRHRNGTGIRIIQKADYKNNPISNLPHDDFEKINLKLDPTSTQSDFPSSAELAEVEELEKGSEYPAPPLPLSAEVKYQTLSPNEQAKIIEGMKKHVVYVEDTNKTKGQESSLRKENIKAQRVHLNIGKDNEAVQLNIPGQASSAHQVPQEEDEEEGEDQTPSKGELEAVRLQAEEDRRAFQAVDATWNEDQDINEGEVPPEMTKNEIPTENVPTFEEPTETETGSPNRSKRSADINYEDSLHIAAGERLKPDDYFDPGMNARLVKRLETS